MSLVNLPEKKQKRRPYFEFLFALLELVSELLVVLQQGDLGLHRRPLQHLQQSGTLAPLLPELSVSLSLQQLKLATRSVVVSGDALQEESDRQTRPLRRRENTCTLLLRQLLYK